MSFISKNIELYGSAFAGTVSSFFANLIFDNSGTALQGIKGADGQLHTKAFENNVIDYKVGCHYFPGWNANPPYGGALASSYPTTPPFTFIPTNRQPLQGAYDEAQQAIADYNLQVARDHNVYFFSYCWYTQVSGSTLTPFLPHAINNHMSSTVANKPQFCVNWCCNQYNTQFSATNFQYLVNYWIANYFSDPSYLQINGKPVVMIFDTYWFKNITGLTTDALIAAALNTARNAAIAAGFNGIHFVGLQSACSAAWKAAIAAEGWDGVSSYNVPYRFQLYSNAPFTQSNNALPLYGYDIIDDAIYGDLIIGTDGNQYNSWAGTSGRGAWIGQASCTVAGTINITSGVGFPDLGQTFISPNNGSSGAITTVTDYAYDPVYTITAPGVTPFTSNACYTESSLTAYADCVNNTGGHWQAPATQNYGMPSLGLQTIMPINSGFDSRPWVGGSSQLATNGMPTLIQWENHLIKARRAIDLFRSQTQGFGVVAAWNEFGEGQILAPNQTEGYGKLKIFKRIFGGG